MGGGSSCSLSSAMLTSDVNRFVLTGDAPIARVLDVTDARAPMTSHCSAASVASLPTSTASRSLPARRDGDSVGDPSASSLNGDIGRLRARAAVSSAASEVDGPTGTTLASAAPRECTSDDASDVTSTLTSPTSNADVDSLATLRAAVPGRDGGAVAVLRGRDSDGVPERKGRRERPDRPDLGVSARSPRSSRSAMRRAAASTSSFSRASFTIRLSSSAAALRQRDGQRSATQRSAPW
jgi:hypothetical protein